MNGRVITSFGVGCAVAACAWTSGTAKADPIVDVDFSAIQNLYPGAPGGYFGFEEGHANGMVGWTFRPKNDIKVTHIGWYDKGGDGLSRDFSVGIWRDNDSTNAQAFASAGNITSLVTGNVATIPAGTAGTLVGHYRTVALSKPLTLSADYRYEIGGLDSSTTTDAIQYIFGGPPSPLVTTGQFFYPFGTSTGFGPTTQNSFYLENGLELGPMLFTSIPEPAALTVIALAGWLTTRRGRDCIRVHQR